MEANPIEAEKCYVEKLHALRQKYGKSNPFFMRRRSTPQQFFDLDKRDIRILEEAGVIKVERTVRNWLEGRENTERVPDPDAFTVTILPKGEQLLKSRVTTTQTVTELFQEPEEPTWKANKRFRNFARTERGGAILCSPPDALISDVRGNIEVLRRGRLSRSEWRVRQIWLKLELMYRSEDIPEALRHEAEDYRDLEWHGKQRRKPT
jgi:hypothetical protein